MLAPVLNSKTPRLASDAALSMERAAAVSQLMMWLLVRAPPLIFLAAVPVTVQVEFPVSQSPASEPPAHPTTPPASAHWPVKVPARSERLSELKLPLNLALLLMATTPV